MLPMTPQPDLTFEEAQERHPELRLRLLPADDPLTPLHSRSPASPGAYEWWQIDASTDDGSGLRFELCNGDPFHPDYRETCAQLRTGRMIPASACRPSGYPGLRLALFDRGEVFARADLAYPPDSFREEIADGQWKAILGPHRLTADSTELTASVRCPVMRSGLRGLLRPGLIPGSQLTLSINVRREFTCPALQRSSYPDANDGSTHDWIIALPAAVLTLEAALSVPGQPDRHLSLSHARGTVEHFWGAGPAGEGFRRFYTARSRWDSGTAVGELTILRKFIQIAPTLLLFAPETEPAVYRCLRPASPEYQRSAWLLAYPLNLRFEEPEAGVVVDHVMEARRISLPHQGLARTRCTVTHPNWTRQCAGTFDFVQPARGDWGPWSRWARPVAHRRGQSSS